MTSSRDGKNEYAVVRRQSNEERQMLNTGWAPSQGRVLSARRKCSGVNLHWDIDNQRNLLGLQPRGLGIWGRTRGSEGEKRIKTRRSAASTHRDPWSTITSFRDPVHEGPRFLNSCLRGVKEKQFKFPQFVGTCQGWFISAGTLRGRGTPLHGPEAAAVDSVMSLMFLSRFSFVFRILILWPCS